MPYRNRKYIFSFVIIVLVLVSGIGIASERLPLQFPFESYQQQVELTFDSSASARKASIEIESLYDGFTRAVSCRWDDNNDTNLSVKKFLDERGVKATWYLNSNSIFYLNGQDYKPTVQKLLENGHSIGGHGYNHPYIAYTNRNRMFQEAAQNRIEWESEMDTLMNSYAFSFVNYRNILEGEVSQQDVIQTLERAGFYHLSVFKTFDEQQPSEMIVSMIMPPENNDFATFKQAVDWAMNSEDLLERYRCVSHSMHSWYGTSAVEYGFDELEKRLDYMNSFPDLWYCNQNQYAAYRYQYLNAELEISKKGKHVICTLTRPVLRQLNDDTAITLSVKGVKARSVRNVEIDGKKLNVSKRSSKDSILINIPHDRFQYLPEKIAYVANPDNRSEFTANDHTSDFPGLRTLLSFDGRVLTLNIDNQSGKIAKDINVTYRLPLAWAEGVRTNYKGGICHGQKWKDTWAPTVERDDLKYMGGWHYMVAQIDFDYDGKPARIYATCNYNVPFDDTFPRDGFALLGPVDPVQFDMDAFAESLKTRGGVPLEKWKLRNGSEIGWRSTDDNAPVDNDHFDPEVIRTQGDWYNTNTPLYVLYSVIRSDAEQWAKAVFDIPSVKAIYINGKRLEGFGVKLRRGENHFIVVHNHNQFTGNGEHAGAFLRLADPNHEKQLKTIHYKKPKIKMSESTSSATVAPGVKPPLKIAVMQMQGSGFDQQANLEKADEFCRQAATTGADIALMPEMFNIGYTAFQGTEPAEIKKWQDRAVARDSQWVQHFANLAKELNMAVGVTYLEKWDPAPRNTITVFDRHGKDILTYAKVHTCDFANFEASTTPGEDWYVADLDTKTDTIKLGAMICYDREFPESARVLMLKGAEVVLTPNACLLDDIRLAQFGTRALENGMVMVMTNYGGPGYEGRSVIYTTDGSQLVEGHSGEGVFTATVNMGWLREAKKRSIWGNSFRRPHRYGIITSMEKEPVYERENGLGEPFVPAQR